MRVIDGQFVFAETIEAALARARSAALQSQRYSFDMLGEAALTAEDARRYFGAYEQAIHAVGVAYRGLGPVVGGSVSVKLSALHPRYEYGQRERVASELGPRLAELRSTRAALRTSRSQSMRKNPTGSCDPSSCSKA